MDFAKFDNLNNLSKGVNKRWVYKDSNAFHLARGYF